MSHPGHLKITTANTSKSSFKRVAQEVFKAKADWYDPIVAAEDPVFGRRNHAADLKDKTPVKGMLFFFYDGKESFLWICFAERTC